MNGYWRAHSQRANERTMRWMNEQTSRSACVVWSLKPLSNTKFTLFGLFFSVCLFVPAVVVRESRKKSIYFEVNQPILLFNPESEFSSYSWIHTLCSNDHKSLMDNYNLINPTLFSMFFFSLFKYKVTLTSTKFQKTFAIYERSTNLSTDNQIQISQIYLCSR